MKSVAFAIAAGAGFYLAVLAALFAWQRRLIYYPDTAYYTPADAGLTGVTETVLTTKDGARLIAWYAPPASGKPVLLYFHGNAGGLISRAERVAGFMAAGYGVFILAYRGYAGSTGEPSEAAIIADANLAYDHLLSQGFTARDIVLYGESLGTGVAVQLAAARPVAAVVLDSPYTSLADIGQEVYPYVPVKMLMVDRFDSLAHIGKLRAPLLVLHGDQDTTIPLRYGKALFEAAPEPKEMAVIAGAAHSNIYAFGALPVLRRFLDAHVGRGT